MDSNNFKLKYPVTFVLNILDIANHLSKGSEKALDIFSEIASRKGIPHSSNNKNLFPIYEKINEELVILLGQELTG